MNQTKINFSRDQTMDFLKGIGMIYVVIGHTLVNPMHDLIYTFHMPLFYFISGFLYNDDYSLHPQKLLISRLKTLYIPFLKYELIFLLLHNLFFKINIYSEIITYNGSSVKLYNMHDFIIALLHIITFGGREQLLGAFWFFTVLFTINITFCFIRYFFLKVLHQNNEIFIFLTILIIYVIGSILKYYEVTLPRHINISLMAIIVFYLGFLYKTKIEQIPKNKWYAICCLLFIFLGVKYAKINQLKMLIPILWLSLALSGIYFNLYLAEFTKLKNNFLINIIGENTVIIIGLHFLSFKLINLIQVWYYEYPIQMIASFPIIDGSNGWWIAYTFAGIFVPLFMNRILTVLKKNKLSSLLFI